MKPRPVKDGDRVEGTVVTLWVTRRNSDGTEGRGADVDHSYHLDRLEAQVATHGIDVMGSDGHVEERLALRTDDNRFFLLPKPITLTPSAKEKETMARVRREALNKLTPAERVALLGQDEEDA